MKHQSVRSYKPFHRIQIDLMEVKPSGAQGERYVMTAICVCTRYIFLRACDNREAPELAMLLLDILLDCGVILAVIQSDNEFLNLAFEELFALLGSNQIFSVALRPQSQGIVERSHRDIRNQLAILVEAFARSNPRNWPQYLRYVEHKLRHRDLVSGITPYAAVHGFYGSSTLSTAMGALESIPEDIIWADWVHSLVSETKRINSCLSEHWNSESALRARKHGEAKSEPDFTPGELVLLAKPFYEKGTGVILPQCDGPYVIYKLPTPHIVLLHDTLTNESVCDGKPVAVSRLIRFKFPHDWAGAEVQDVEDRENMMNGLKPGMFIAVSPKTSFFNRIHVARVERPFVGQELCEVTLYTVPKGNRTGPWQARRWVIWQNEDGTPKREVITKGEFITKVSLVNDALTQESFETLTMHGVPAGEQPRLDSSLPPKRMA